MLTRVPNSPDLRMTDSEGRITRFREAVGRGVFRIHYHGNLEYFDADVLDFDSYQRDLISKDLFPYAPSKTCRYTVIFSLMVTGDIGN